MKYKTKMIFKVLIVCIILMIIMSSCFLLTGKLVDKEKSPYYYYGYGFFKDNIYYFAGKQVGDSPEKLEGADKKTFRPIAEFYGIDKYRVYLTSRGITNVDAPTFELLVSDGGYERYLNYISGNKDSYYSFGRDKNHVYWLSVTSSGGFTILPDANPVTFQPLGNKWSKDDKNVYYNLEKVDANPQTFVNINETYSKDENYLYVQNAYSGKALIKEKCNTNELVSVAESNYIHTNTKIYYFCDEYFTSLPLKDTTSIENLYDSWLKVDGKIVLDGRWVEDSRVDEKTFVSLGRGFFKDEKNVYYWKWRVSGKSKTEDLFVISDADWNTFEQIGGGYAKDKNHAYYRNEILPDANPADFRYDEENSKGYSGKYIYDSGEKVNK